ANQHTTYTDKELDNVLDISHLKIKVGHPNGTKAFISNIGNLKLSNDLILLGHPAKPILNALRDSLQFDNKDQTMCCEIFQRAKQSREPFPLSDHTSKFLGDLVHLELWGPYKITVLTTNTPYPSRKIQRICAYTHQKTTKETRSIRRIQRRPIRRIGDIVREYSRRYQAWSLLQETSNTSYPRHWIRRIKQTPDPINRKLKNEF
ncbi:hypothetical protein Tco_1261584, partial [Tanacetum coccineum]